MPRSSGRRNAIDGLRGVAVLLTFMVHFDGLYLIMFRHGNPDVTPFAGWSELFDKVLFWLYHSHHGVHIFFILSGFLICRITLNPRQTFHYPTFIRYRFVRIYPAFILALCICLGASRLIFGSPPPSFQAVLGNMVFLNALPTSGVPPLVFNNVSWSLFYEASFYLVFPIIAMAARRSGRPPAMVLMVGGLAVAYWPFPLGIYTEFFVLFFAGSLVGLLDARQAQAFDGQISDNLLIVLYLMLTTSSMLGSFEGSRFILLFSAAGGMIVLKAAHGRGIINRALAWGPLVWLGGVSYSFYLLHCVPLFLIFNYLPVRSLDPGPLHAVVLAVLTFAGALTLAAVSFALTERPYFQKRHNDTTLIRAVQQTD